MIKKYKEVIAGIGIILFAIILFIGITQIKVPKMIAASNSVDAKFFPTIAASALAVLGVVIVIDGLRYARSFDPEEEEKAPKDGVRIVLYTLVAIAAYTYFFNILGFMIASFLFLVAEMAILAPKEKRNYPLFILISAITSASIYYFFTKVLYLILPAGILR